MNTLLAIGLANAICAAVLAVPAWLAGRRGRPALAHALWLLVLVKLVTPPVFQLPLPWLPPDDAVAQTASGAEPSTPDDLAVDVVLPATGAGFSDHKPVPGDWIDVTAAAPRQPGASPANVPASRELQTPAQPISPAETVQPEEEASASASSSADVAPLLVLVWLGGVLFCLSRTVLLMLRFQALLVNARLAPEEVQRQARELARSMGLRRCPAVWLVPGALPPMVWALGRARILFPVGLLARLGEEERASLLAHELAHVRRRDHWVRWLEVVALALYWWYPLTWWARVQLQTREEECCDAWAAQQVPPRTYAGAILETVDFLAEARPRLPAVASPLAGARALRQRLTLVMTGAGQNRLGWLARVLLLGLAVSVLPMLPSLTRSCHSAAPPAATSNEQAAPAAEENEAEPTAYLENNPVNLTGDNDGVYSVAISPDGSRIAAGMGNPNRPGQVDVWDLRTRKLLWSQEEDRGVASVTFSHDSKRLAWACWGGLFRIEQLMPRRGISRVLFGDSAHRLAYSRDGKWLALAGENRGLYLLDAATGRQVHRLEGDLTNFFSVNFSNDGKLLAAGGGRFNANGGNGPNQVHLFDVTTRKQVGKLTGHTLAVINIAFAKNDTLIATASADSTVRIWDGKTYQMKKELRGHSAGVKGLAFSPDGKTLATGSWDRTIRLWDPIEGKQLAQLEGHSDFVREIAFSPDGNYLVSGGGRRSVKLWDVKQRKLIATLREDPEPGKAAPLLTMTVSPDGKYLVTGDEDGKIQFRDSRSGIVRKTLNAHEDAVTALAFSRDGNYLASSGPDTIVRVWDTKTDKVVQALKGHTSWVYSLAFSSDGKRLASGSYDRSIRLWDPATGKDMGKLTGHKATIRALVFSPDGKLLASGGADHKVRLWDLQTMKRKAVLSGHGESSVRGLAFSPDGKALISVGEDGQLRRWDPVKETEIGKPLNNLGEVVTLASTPSRQRLVVGNQGGNLFLVDAATGALGQRWYSRHGQGLVTVALAPGGQRLYSLGGGGQISVWHPKPGPLRLLEGHSGPVRIATFSPDGKYLLSCGGWPEGDKTLRLWDVKTGKQVRLLLKAPEQVQSAVFSPDGKYAATGVNTGVIHLIDVSNGKDVRQFKGHKDGIPGLTFSRDGKWLLSAGVDKTVRLWDAKTGDEVRAFKGHTDWARCAIFHPDGKRILSGGRDRVIRVWDRETGKELKSIDHNKEWVERMALLPDGKRLLTCGGDLMRLWDIESGKQVRAFSGHQFGVTWLAPTRDGRKALTTSYDGSVRLWDVETGLELNRFSSHRNWVWSVDIAPDGKTFATAGGGGKQGENWVAGDDFAIRLWKLPPTSVARAQ
jgi:WD40 repeat protein/beta-lactamase regulating signal transducer with metallopeptidase domain